VLKDIGVYDAFLPEPDSYRRFALQQTFRSFEFEHCTFHGIAPLSLSEFVPTAIGKLLAPSVSTLSFLRRSPLGQEEPHFIHTDIDMGDWSAILYLNENPPEGDGTTFWTHKPTGAIESLVPHERSEEGRSPQGWGARKTVQARFNRLLIFPSSYFHSRAIFDNWGRGDDARLTQVTFGRWAA
jgi:hypothetical protein